MVKPIRYLPGVVSFTYTNWKGETRRGQVSCKRVEDSWIDYLNVRYSTPHAIDIEKETDRSFHISENQRPKRRT